MRDWKAIILAGGTGQRLHPLSLAVNKHLLPVYNKPMIYYSLSTIMLSGIRDIILISSKRDLPHFQRLLRDGSQWGLKISYLVQARPRGIAECFLIAAEHIFDCNVALVLGDNIFHSDRLQAHLESAITQKSGATVFACEVADPSAFGVIEFDSSGRPISIEEKPKLPRSRFVVTGLYCYDNGVVDIARSLHPSARGELEITDINLAYLKRGDLRAIRFGRGFAWLDGGTPTSLFDAGQFIKVVEERTGLMIACPEEIAFRRGYISATQLKALAGADTPYARYLLSIADGSVES